MLRKKRNDSEEVIKLPLLEELNNLNLFSDRIKMQEIPLYIKDNLKHKLRSYQFSALQNLDAVMHLKDARSRNQLMFNMATGSGKTDIMAASILYMYQELGYQCFLFTSTSTAVIDKTIDNFINTASPKYLFTESKRIYGESLNIRNVDVFPTNLEKNTIYISFSSIQGLVNTLYIPHENAIDVDTLRKQKIVILADEAHHFNVETRGKNKKNIDSRNWEKALDDVRNLNPENKQLEFTATIDLHNTDIYNKYKNKIIARYDLQRFINDGYSKKVFRLQANNDDETKMLNAVLLSQYRKHLASDLGIPNFKPVILFKSNSVPLSKKTTEVFLSMIANLTAESLERFINTQSRSIDSEALKITYDYWNKQNYGETVSELKKDFQRYTTVNANDSTQKSILDDSYIGKRLNTLESPKNPIRAIFAVAKLSEGWDVLNLYDIVRIGEKNIGQSETNSEAQLIGRGARYYPFVYKGSSSYTRRFDQSKTSYQLLERLYYHTINDPVYLKNLRESFNAINLPVEDDADVKTYTAKVKPSFTRTNIYKYGSLYLNKVQTVPDAEYDNIQKYGIDPENIQPVNLIGNILEKQYDSDVEKNDDTGTTIVSVASFKNKADKALIRTAISGNDFFRFKSLKDVCPLITSIDEFLTSDKWLGKITVQAYVPNNLAEKGLSPQQKLKAVSLFLSRVERSMSKNYKKSRGTNVFQPIPIKDVIDNYEKHVPQSFNQSSLISPYPMQAFDWFVYDYAIVDMLEKNLIDKVRDHMNDFKAKYQNVYLLRIDESSTNFKLHDFGEGVYHYGGYMPDFVLYLQNENYIYQIYVEPKGDHLLKKDDWKQKLLEKINPKNIIILGENDRIKLYGVKFFTKNDGRHIFDELVDKGILEDKAIKFDFKGN